MQPKVVTAAIAIDTGHILIARRAPGQSLEGYWEFPGGKVELGESLQECLVREIEEELGVHAHVGDVFAESIYTYEKGSIQLVALITTFESIDFTLSVHDMIEWVDIPKLLEYQLAPADISIAEKVMNTHDV